MNTFTDAITDEQRQAFCYRILDTATPMLQRILALLKYTLDASITWESVVAIGELTDYVGDILGDPGLQTDVIYLGDDEVNNYIAGVQRKGAEVFEAVQAIIQSAEGTEDE